MSKDQPDKKPDVHEVLTNEQAIDAVADWLVKNRRAQLQGEFAGVGLVFDVQSQVFHFKAWR
jgi:hypothetical protein